MVRFILLSLLFILVARAFWRLMDGVIEAARGGQPGHRGGNTQAMKLVRDPVCGTYVPPRAALSLTSAGSTHYFCSEQCKTEFAKRS
ncbi:MAG: hypothetical protein HW394_421 [Acidobacteria bacterium]|nr:hypothetical protein [Acidobacteriota bacterium]